VTQTTYMILPPGRDWSDDLQLFAQSLVDGARGQHGELAALSLLFRDPDLTVSRADFRDLYVRGIVGPRVEWATLHTDAGCSALPLSRQARALVMLACSMASRTCTVRLGELLGDIADGPQAAFVDAMAYLVSEAL
jgi:hypothetical protein